MKDADKISAEYLMRQVPDEDWPSFVSSPRIQDGPEHVSPLRFVGGWVVVLAIAALIFWGL